MANPRRKQLTTFGHNSARAPEHHVTMVQNRDQSNCFWIARKNLVLSADIPSKTHFDFVDSQFCHTIVHSEH